MWGRIILVAVVVVLVVVWLAAIWILVMDPRTLLQKWQGGLWNGANWPVSQRAKEQLNQIASKYGTEFSVRQL